MPAAVTLPTATKGAPVRRIPLPPPSTRLVLAAVVAASLVTALGAPSRASAASADPGQTVATLPPCAYQAVAGGLTSGNGRLAGFLGCAWDQAAIFAVARRGRAWSAEQTPYTGRLVAQAADATGTYVLFATAGDHTLTTDWLLLGKRTGGGAYAPAVSVGRAGWLTEGALAARGGEWWAVWAQREPGGKQSLHQARTFGRDLGPSVVREAGTADLAGLDLALDARGATLAAGFKGRGREGVRLGRGTGDGWAFRELTGRAARPSWVPVLGDLYASGGTVWAAWERDGQVMVTSRRGGRVATTRLGPGGSPRLTAWRGGVAVGYTSTGPDGTSRHAYLHGVDAVRGVRAKRTADLGAATLVGLGTAEGDAVALLNPPGSGGVFAATVHR